MATVRKGGEMGGGETFMFHDATGLAKADCSEDVTQCRQGESCDFLECVNNSLGSLPLCLCS